MQKRIPDQIRIRKSGKADAVKPYIVERYSCVTQRRYEIEFYLSVVGRYSGLAAANSAAERAAKKYSAVNRGIVNPSRGHELMGRM